MVASGQQFCFYEICSTICMHTHTHIPIPSKADAFLSFQYGPAWREGTRTLTTTVQQDHVWQLVPSIQQFRLRLLCDAGCSWMCSLMRGYCLNCLLLSKSCCWHMPQAKLVSRAALLVTQPQASLLYVIHM